VVLARECWLTLDEKPMDAPPVPVPDAVPDAVPAPGSKTKRNVRAAIASVVLIVGFGWLMNRGGLPLLPPEGTLDHLDIVPFAGFVLGMVFHMLTRFARCHYLIAPITPVPMRRLMTINAIAMALITLLPLRLGEMARPAMLRDKGHLSILAVTGTVAAERILDGVVFSAMLLLGLGIAIPHTPLPDHIGALPVPASLVPKVARLAALAFGVAFVVMSAFYFYRSFATRVTEKVVGIVSPAFGRKVAAAVGRVSDGLRFMREPRHTVPYLLVTIVSVAGHVWAVQLLAQSVGLSELTFSQSMVVVGVLALGFGMPNAPGFFGAVQLALYAGLLVYVAPEKVVHEGAALVFLFYVTYVGIILLMAAISLVIDYALPQSPRPVAT
jgi:hypothetical protein